MGSTGKGNKGSMHIQETERGGMTKSWVLEGRSTLLLSEGGASRC